MNRSSGDRMPYLSLFYGQSGFMFIPARVFRGPLEQLLTEVH
jgi:hypothetical protein